MGNVNKHMATDSGERKGVLWDGDAATSLQRGGGIPFPPLSFKRNAIAISAKIENI